MGEVAAVPRADFLSSCRSRYGRCCTGWVSSLQVGTWAECVSLGTKSVTSAVRYRVGMGAALVTVHGDCCEQRERGREQVRTRLELGDYQDSPLDSRLPTPDEAQVL